MVEEAPGTTDAEDFAAAAAAGDIDNYTDAGNDTGKDVRSNAADSVVSVTPVVVAAAADIADDDDDDDVDVTSPSQAKRNPHVAICVHRLGACTERQKSTVLNWTDDDRYTVTFLPSSTPTPSWKIFFTFHTFAKYWTI